MLNTYPYNTVLSDNYVAGVHSSSMIDLRRLNSQSSQDTGVNASGVTTRDVPTGYPVSATNLGVTAIAPGY